MGLLNFIYLHLKEKIMSQTIDNLNAAVVAALAKISELYDENAALKAQVATYADLEAQATALEVAAAADAAAEQSAADKLTAGVKATEAPVYSGPVEPAPTTAEVDAAAAF